MVTPVRRSHTRRRPFPSPHLLTFNAAQLASKTYSSPSYLWEKLTAPPPFFPALLIIDHRMSRLGRPNPLPKGHRFRPPIFLRCGRHPRLTRRCPPRAIDNAQHDLHPVPMFTLPQGYPPPHDHGTLNREIPSPALSPAPKSPASMKTRARSSPCCA